MYQTAYRPRAIEMGSRAFDSQHAYDELAGSGLADEALLRRAITGGVAGRTAVVSSFGADSVVLLSMVAAIDPHLPVLFLQTDRHFQETLSYRDEVASALGLSDVRDITPDPSEAARRDPTGDLWWFDPDACCDLRKVGPLERALEGFDCWITGRKRHQSAARETLPVVEQAAGRIKLNPLAGWSGRQLALAIEQNGLARHPLVSRGYRSIGCANCTRAVGAGEAARDGRWSGTQKVECGIHRARQ